MLTAFSIVLASMLTQASPRSQPTSDEAFKLLMTTKTTQASYSLFTWNRIAVPGKDVVEEWSAEFNSGNLHRVETPRDRLVADCRAGTGTHLSLVTGTIAEGPQIARVACGISTNGHIEAVQDLGSVTTPYGNARRVRVLDDENIRDYDVSADGILIRATFRNRPESSAPLLVAEPLALVRAAPDREMFDKGSLQKSFVPERFRQPPASARK